MERIFDGKKLEETTDICSWAPNLQDSGDLESATKTITATSEGATPDYQASLTLPKPSDGRILIKRIASQLKVTIDDLGGDTNLYCRVYVDDQVAGNRLFDMDWTSTGAKVSVEDVHAGNKATIFNLLKDGSAHTFKFFLWKAGVGTGPIVSLAQVREGVGTYDTGNLRTVAEINHKGLIMISGYIIATSGNIEFHLMNGAEDTYNALIKAGWSNTDQRIEGKDTLALVTYVYMQMKIASANEIGYISALRTVLRSA